MGKNIMFHHRNNNGGNNSTMSRSRYESVPQVDAQEIIELHNDPTYNYNTAIPNSPPPSFHSSQSTPAVSVAGIDFELDRDAEHDRAFNNTTPRPVPSVVGFASGAAGTANGADASASGRETDAAIIQNLHHRVTRLEETIGRLLLSKPEGSSSGPGLRGPSERSNCCVTFPSPSDLSVLERAELLSSPSNCCVTFGGRGRRSARTEEERAARKESRRQWCVAMVIVAVAFGVMGWITLLVWLRSRGPMRVVGCEACFAPGASTAGWSKAGQDENGSWSSSG